MTIMKLLIWLPQCIFVIKLEESSLLMTVYYSIMTLMNVTCFQFVWTSQYVFETFLDISFALPLK